MTALAMRNSMGDMPASGGRVGLLAGGGRFPFLFAQAARARGIEVVCVAIRDHADRALQDVVDHCYWVGLARLGGMIRCFRRERIDRVVMAGKIQKVAMFVPGRFFRLLPDWRTVRFWLSSKRADNRDDSLLLAVIDEFAKDGIRFASALETCPDLLIRPGVATRRSPTARQWSDIRFGWQLAKEMGRLDVGQSVAVKESAALAIEAIEGTDQAIARAGQLCPAGGFTVVKVAKPQQDMRFDVPTVGADTVRSLHRAKGTVLAVEAGKTIVIDAAQTVTLADDLGICIVAVTEEEMA